MNDLHTALFLATLAGATIPIGAVTARWERIQPAWLENEFRHSVIAFGGGILLAAVALVLVPEGTRHLSIGSTLVAFGLGGITFFLLERLIEKRGGALAQLMAMLLDFIPEAIALGAILATQSGPGLLLALLIALQNYPEGFNAYRELHNGGDARAPVILPAFCLLVPLGPLSAWIGFTYLASAPQILGGLMLFSAGGILYLIFEAIAPQTKLNNHWAPPLGAVVGFMLVLFGEHLLG